MQRLYPMIALLSVAGTAMAQLEFGMPVPTGEPQLIAKAHAAKVYGGSHVEPSTKAGLAGNVYSINTYVADPLTAQRLGQAPAHVFVNTGTAGLGLSQTPWTNIFYSNTDPAWANTSPLPGFVPNLPDQMLVTGDSDVEANPGTHEIIIRIWFASNDGLVLPFVQPSVAASPVYTPTILGVNDSISTVSRHPVGLGGDIGDAVNGLGGAGLPPPAGMLWDQSGTNVVTDWLWLGFRQSDAVFVGVDFDTEPGIAFNKAGELVIETLVIQPEALNANPDSGLDDLSVGGGPIVWGDGLTDGYSVYAMQIEFTATAIPDPSACPGDIADDFGVLGADGMVSFGDFLALLGLVGPCPGGTPGCDGDIADDFGTLNGGDGMVSFGDFLALLGLVGPCP